jgi:hypothetical protein
MTDQPEADTARPDRAPRDSRAEMGPRRRRPTVLSDESRARALEVLTADTSAWTLRDWEHTATQLASAVVSAAGDLDLLIWQRDLPPDAVRPLPYDGPPVATPDSLGAP